MVAEAFVIRELTGTQREVELINRALPYRPAEWGGNQHYVQHWYPGNRVATIQVLGPREKNLELKGTWKTRFIGNDVFTTGFDEFIPVGEQATAETLTQVFHSLRIAGNLLEVRWGPEVRRGILSDFNPNYQRVEDVEWTMTFVWSQRDAREAPRASIVRDSVEPVRTAMNNLDDTLATQPIGLNEGPLSAITDAVNFVRQGVTAFTAAVVQVQGAAAVTRARVQQLQTIARQIADGVRAIQEDTVDLPYTDFLPIDDVDSVFDVEVWRRQLGIDARTVDAETLRTLQRIEDDAIPEAIATIAIQQDTTLRALAQQYYGDADSWTLIANANGLIRSVVEAGTIVVIPRAPRQPSSAIIDTTQTSLST